MKIARLLPRINVKFHASGRCADLVQSESAQDQIEYALVAALVALASVVALRALSVTIGAAFNRVGTNLTGAV